MVSVVLKRSIKGVRVLVRVYKHGTLMMTVKIRSLLILLANLAFGSFATLISGLCKQNLSQRLGVSITGYGFPLSWYIESYTVYPNSPIVYSFSWESFVLDILIWSVIVGFAVHVKACIFASNNNS